MRCAVFDIDGTLSDLTHRLHLIQQTPKDWDAFFEACDQDTVIEPVAWLARNLMIAHVPLVMCTGRPHRVREKTQKWLENARINCWALYMRNDGDHRPDEIVKEEMLQTILGIGFDPVIVVDDRAKVVKMWRSHGLTCLQAADGDF